MAIWFVEYSPKQGAFNVHEASDCIESNLKMLARYDSEDQMSGYIPVAVAASQEAASAIAKEMKVRAGIDSWPGVERRFAEIPPDVD